MGSDFLKFNLRIPGNQRKNRGVRLLQIKKLLHRIWYNQQDETTKKWEETCANYTRDRGLISKYIRNSIIEQKTNNTKNELKA